MPANTAPCALPPSTTDGALCPLCGGDNACGQAGAPRATGATCADDPDCWCRTTVIASATLARIPAERRGIACICPGCAAAG